MGKALPRRGRPRSQQWESTATAAQRLGLSPEQLLRLRTQLLKPILHWRCINPLASARGRRYIWRCDRIEPLLAPRDGDTAPN